MKKLTLIRHADAQAGQPGSRDIDRPLSARGREEVAPAAARLMRHAPVDLLIASPARRTQETARLFADALGYRAREVRTDPRLYLASPAHIRAVIRETDDSIAHLAIVAHNPGISDFAADIAAAGFQPLGTCGMVTVELDGDSWFEGA